MDTNMEDVGRAPEPSQLSPVEEPTTIPTLDGWIESLMKCKQLAEVDVQRLCNKVCGVRISQWCRYRVKGIPQMQSISNTANYRHERFYRMSPTFSQW